MKNSISYPTRRQFLAGAMGGFVASRISRARETSNRSSQVAVENRSPLLPNKFNLLPLTSVKPRGWLARQLRIQAEGLTGHLDEFWADVGPNSAWLGGTGESWERGPYYLDGLLPLSYLLEDPKLIAKSLKWVNWTLEHQQPSGLLGPLKDQMSSEYVGREDRPQFIPQDWWPKILMLKVLTQYYEATADPRVPPAMQKYFAYRLRMLPTVPLKEWAMYRWADEILSVFWLYNRTGEPQLLELAEGIRSQGFDWNNHFDSFHYTSKVPKAEATMANHGVNNAMGLKNAAVYSLLSQKDSDRKAIYRALSMLDRYHLLPNGVHSADEHYAGLNPSQGTELCAVVEAMFSLEHLMAILGDASFGDRLERIAFNAWPATFSVDMWAHQYDQQPNQVLCTLQQRDFETNGPESNLFGLEPNYGCCLCNLHQGWPKFTANLWMATPDNGLAAVAYAPNEVQTVVGGGVRVSIVEDTEYPFRETIRLTVNTESPVEFPLQLRIPSWAEDCSVSINGKKLAGAQPGTFLRVQRGWRARDVVEIVFPMRVRTSRWFQDSIAVERGPLVFGLKIGEAWRKLREKSPAADWEVTPTTPWNYALRIDADHPEKSVTIEEKPGDEFPFGSTAPRVVLKVRGRRLPEWNLVNGSAAPPPPSPVESSKPEENLTLIPYGSAKLRVTAFPQLQTGRT